MMNLGQLKKAALVYIDEYSTDGVLTPDGDNMDYLLKIPFFANDVQEEISKFIPIDASKTFELTSYTPSNGYYKIPLPSDYKRLKGLRLDDDVLYGYAIENNNILISADYSGTLELLYYKNPTFIDSDTPDTYEFEVDSYTHSLIPIYVAGMLATDSTDGKSERLLNLYYGKLGNLRKQDHDSISEITVI